MGCLESKSEEARDAQKRNREVESLIKQTKSAYINEIKLLLLGAGESGKSTIAKQMKILHTAGFTKEELISYRPVIFNNTISSMKTLIHACSLFGVSVSETNKEAANQIVNLHAAAAEELSSVGVSIKILWEDPAIQKAYSRRNEFQLVDSAAYCFQNIDRFLDTDFIPNDKDILNARARTSGIIETTFKVKDTHFRMIDVGGQRSERKKWIHCFEDVTAIIFCVALNEYDMKLFEDQRVNRMVESLELFTEIANSKWFTKTAIILFLNKSDLFREKIQNVDLNVLFEDYTGGCSYDNAIAFLRNIFIQVVKQSPSKKLFVKETCATDTENVRVVFTAAKEIIIAQNLARLGFPNL